MYSDDVDSVFFKYHLIKAESPRLIVVFLSCKLFSIEVQEIA